MKIGKQEQYWRIKAPPAAGAPYDRLSDLLHTKVWELYIDVLSEFIKQNCFTYPINGVAKIIKVRIKLNVSHFAHSIL